MKVVDSPSGGGPRGVGSIVVTGEGRAEVTIKDREQNVSKYALTFEQGVENVRIRNWPLQTINDVYINLTPDELDFVYPPRPKDGTFYVKFSRFGAEPGELPTIKHDEPKDYEGNPWLPERYKFFALYEILNPGPYQGAEVLQTLTYEFEWDENLEEFAIVGGKKKWHDELLDFLGVFGFDLQNDDLHYTAEDYDAGGTTSIPNVLPELEDILRSRNQVAQVVVKSTKSGWINVESLSKGPYGMTPETMVAMLTQAQSQVVPA